MTRSTDFQFRKSADPISILCFSVSLSAILCTPFAKKFQEKLGEEAATQAIAFAKWIGKSVAHKIGSMKKPSRLILQTRYQHCRLEFVIESKDPTVISRAAEALDDAAAAAIRLCNTLSPDDPSRLVYEFNGERNIWQPCYAITARTGVIVAQPHLLLAEHLNGGFSLGGTLTRREEKEV